MEASDKTKKIFQFEDERQTEVYKSLRRFIGDAPASFFKDACKIMQGDGDLEAKTNLVGHLLRETFAWILPIMLPINYVEPKTDDKINHKQMIKDAAKEYEIDEGDEQIKFWLKNTGKKGFHSWAHRGGMESVRPVDSSFEEVWNGSVLLLSFLLEKIESNFTKYMDQLDEILQKTTIKPADIKKLKEHIPLNAITLGYFFDRLDHPECLMTLKSRGFFKYPRKPLEHEEGGISYPLWPQMNYLVKISTVSSVQDEVFKICLEIDTENINTQVQILEIALNLPPEKGAELVKKTYSWFGNMNSWFQPEKYGKLIAYLAKSGLHEEALELAEKILEIKPDPRKPKEIDGYKFPYEPIALFDDWHYENLLKEDFLKLVDETGIKAINILLDQIENYIKLSDLGKEEGSRDDYSYVWRNAIEDNPQNFNHGVRDLLVTGVRDAMERHIKNNHKNINEVLDELEKRKLKIFKRLSLHLLRLFPDKSEKRIASILTNKKEFETERFEHEYYLLAEERNSLLDTSSRETVWKLILEGADIKSYKKWRKRQGVDPKKEEIEKYVKNWQLYHLSPFKNNNKEWERYYDELVKAIGQPDHPSLRSWSSGGSFGPESIVSNEQLKKMEPSQIIEYLTEWEPEQDDPLNRSREGTGRELSKQIADDPKKWSSVLPSVSQLDPTYVRSIFVGLRDAIKNGKEIDWSSLLELSKLILKKPIEIEKRKKSTPFGDDPDWRWTRHAIVEVITEGLKSKPSIELRKEIWELLEPFTNDPDPTPEHEKKYLASNHDPLSMAINSTRGDALDAAIQYGIWLKDSLPEDKKKDWSLSKDAPELLKVLNDHLDIKKDPSLGIRALYGEKLGVLTYLDEGWVKGKYIEIFPNDDKLQNYFDASWEAYITFVHAYDNLFKIINSVYGKAVGEIGKHKDKKHHLNNPDQNLIHHLIQFYWRGIIKLDDVLLTRFYEKSSLELRAEAIDFIGRAFNENKDVPDQVVKRAILLLESRLKTVSDSNPLEIQEFENFGWWIASENFDDKWALDMLLTILEAGCDLEGEHIVIKRFKELAEKFPEEIIKCCKLMVENDKKGWGIAHWGQDLEEIISSILSSSNKKAQQAAKDFINILASRGYLNYKNLISN